MSDDGAIRICQSKDFSFKKFINLISSNLSCLGISKRFTSKLMEINDIHYLSNLTSLNLHSNNVSIANEGIRILTKLTSLDLSNNVSITNEGIQHLTNLTSLNLTFNKLITNEGIQHLTNLTSLNLDNNEFITNEGTQHYKN